MCVRLPSSVLGPWFALSWLDAKLSGTYSRDAVSPWVAGESLQSGGQIGRRFVGHVIDDPAFQKLPYAWD